MSDNDSGLVNQNPVQGLSVTQLVSQLKASIIPELSTMVNERFQSLSAGLSNSQSRYQRSGLSPASSGEDHSSNLAGFTDGEDDEADCDFEMDPLDRLAKSTWEPPLRTKEALEKYMRRQLDKQEREAISTSYPLPAVPVTRSPALDKPLSNLLTQRKIGLKNIPGVLALDAVQVRMLDAVGPLSALHAAAEKCKETGSVMSPSSVLEALNHALILIGNANSQAIYQRQRAILHKLSPSSVSLLSKATLPNANSDELFGTEIRKAIKEASDVRKEFGAPQQFNIQSRFKSYRPKYQQRTGGGGERNRFSPYDRFPQKQQRSFPKQAPFRGPSFNKEIQSDATGSSPFCWNGQCGKVSSTHIIHEDTEPSDEHNHHNEGGFELGCANEHDLTVKKRITMVEQIKRFPPISNSHGRAYAGNCLGFEFGRLGSLLPGFRNGRKVVTRRPPAISAYKSTGTTSSIPSNQVLLDATPYKRTTFTRQQIRRSLHQQNWWHTFVQPQQVGSKSLGVVRDTQCMDNRRIYSRYIKQGSRLGVQTSTRLQLLDAETGGFHRTLQPIQVGCGSIRRQEQQSTSKILELETGPRSTGHGCVHDNVEKDKGLRFSTILFNRAMSPEDTGGGGENPSCSTNMEEPALVPSPTSVPVFSTDSATSGGRPTVGSHRESPPTGSTKETNAGSVACDGGSRESRAISEHAEYIVSNAIRPKSKKSYNSAWRCFSGWCNQRNCDPIQTTPTQVVEYLAHLHKKSLAYRTINLHRSAISYFVPHQNGISIGTNPLVSKFMKGSFNLNPPVPRYTQTWDPTVLLTYLEKIGDNNVISFSLLRKKLVCLLALCKASRSSDICALDLSGMRETSSGVIFNHVHLRKTSRVGHLPESFYPKFEENSTLCVVTTLKSYIERTNDLRKSSRLIIATRKPCKEVTSRTIARWILDSMKEAGIDTSTYKSHSVRSASTSFAYSKGVSLSDIQRSADWSVPNTFLRYYYRPTETGSMGSSVIYQSMKL